MGRGRDNDGGNKMKSRDRFRAFLYRWHRRWIPRLVWVGQEIDVSICFLRCGFTATKNKTAALYQAEDGLRKLGISFDTGSGCEGRDWEWDWALRGPMVVTFRGHKKRIRREPVETPQEVIAAERDLIVDAIAQNRPHLV